MRSAVMRALRFPAFVLVVYLVLRLAFDRATGDGGLLAPSGMPRLPIAVLGLVVVMLRLVVLFVLPPLVAYRAVILAGDAIQRKRARSASLR